MVSPYPGLDSAEYKIQTTPFVVHMTASTKVTVASDLFSAEDYLKDCNHGNRASITVSHLESNIQSPAPIFRH